MSCIAPNSVQQVPHEPGGTALVVLSIATELVGPAWGGFGRRAVYDNGSWSFRLSALMAVAFWLLLLVQYAGPRTGITTPEPEFEVTRDDGIVSVQVSLWLDCTPSAVWALMTDYESLSTYMPNVESSEVLARSDTVARVRQGGQQQHPGAHSLCRAPRVS